MFGKLWKTIKFFLIVGIVLICLPHSILPKQNNDIRKSDLEEYRKLNDEEKRLSAYRDDDQALRLKLQQLDVINLSRRKNNVAELKLDILASRVANRMAKEAAVSNFVGHWNLAGEKPYQRYGAAGGYDHVMENAFGQWTTGSYDQSEASVISMMKKGHETFMEEKPPYDGHKKNVINKAHNFVGIGYYLTAGQFRYYEEFIDRKFGFENIPGRVSPGEQFNITVTTPEGSYLYYAVVYRDPFPKPMTASEISRIGSYNDFGDDQYLTMAAWDLAAFRKGNKYLIPLKFDREGYYYIQLYEDKKEITGGGSVSTSGKTPYSGIVIKSGN